MTEHVLYMITWREKREKIKCISQDERENPECIMILKKLYAQSPVSLQQYFFSWKQLDGESLQEFNMHCI